MLSISHYLDAVLQSFHTPKKKPSLVGLASLKVPKVISSVKLERKKQICSSRSSHYFSRCK